MEVIEGRYGPVWYFENSARVFYHSEDEIWVSFLKAEKKERKRRKLEKKGTAPLTELCKGPMGGEAVSRWKILQVLRDRTRLVPKM